VDGAATADNASPTSHPATCAPRVRVSCGPESALLVFLLACAGRTDSHHRDSDAATDTEGGDTDHPDTDVPIDTGPTCGSVDAVTGWQPTVHITSGGVDRTYSLYVPASWNADHRWPIAFAFHGDGGTGAGMRAMGLEQASEDAAILVYPDATQASGRSFDIETPYDGNADMQLFSDILASLEGSHCADPGRVYATGFSRGAFFVNFLNCRLGDTVLKGIAAHSGSGPYGDDYDDDGHFVCQAPAAAALLIHGQDDTVVPISDARYTYGQWTWADGCDGTTSGYGHDPCVQQDGCDTGKPVVWCAIPGMGHELWADTGPVVWGFFENLP
jgi:polyhydroxybutyrate depolymerase